MASVIIVIFMNGKKNEAWKVKEHIQSSIKSHTQKMTPTAPSCLKCRLTFSLRLSRIMLFLKETALKDLFYSFAHTVSKMF